MRCCHLEVYIVIPICVLVLAFFFAGLRMDKGYQIACERIQGVNDNMAKSHYHEYFELYYLESGKRYHIADDTLYCLNSG